MVRVVKKPVQRRREIIAASRKLFLKKGYENTTMQDVMATLQIAKGTTYHYFKSKAELLEAVVEDMVDEYISKVAKVLKNCQGNALEKMRVLVEAGRSKGVDMVEGLHLAGNMGMHVRLLAETITRLAPLYARVIEQGCEEGVFHTEHPLECAEVLLGGIQFLTDVGCYPWKKQDLTRRMQAIPELLENQLQASKNSLNFLFEQS
ncbi:MAG: TetR/AcrR family transcriptional regulator [Simkaniaceae bacterium]|nr:TetR/AcrR family transcriptional regulator [Candidatus Sacchlamyda saccharinae]